MGEHIFPTFSQKAIDFWRSIIGDDFRPLYYRHGNLTDIGLLPHVDTVEEFRIILSSKDFDKFYRSRKKHCDLEKNAKLTKEKLIRARGSWFVDHILGTYALKRQNLDWSGVKDQHVTSYLKPLLEMGHIFDSDKEFGPDLVKRRDLSNLVKLMDAKSISTEWNIKNFDIQGRWSGYEGAYYPRLGCGQISSAIYQQFWRLGEPHTLIVILNHWIPMINQSKQ